MICSGLRVTRAPLRRFARDERGAVLVEYIVVAAFAGILVALALVTVGPKTVRNYSGQRGALYQHSP
jgi:Flp pilus assembly pilin Flp